MSASQLLHLKGSHLVMAYLQYIVSTIQRHSYIPASIVYAYMYHQQTAAKTRKLLYHDNDLSVQSKFPNHNRYFIRGFICWAVRIHPDHAIFPLHCPCFCCQRTCRVVFKGLTWFQDWRFSYYTRTPAHMRDVFIAMVQNRSKGCVLKAEDRIYTYSTGFLVTCHVTKS